MIYYRKHLSFMLFFPWSTKKTIRISILNVINTKKNCNKLIQYSSVLNILSDTHMTHTHNAVLWYKLHNLAYFCMCLYYWIYLISDNHTPFGVAYFAEIVACAIISVPVHVTILTSWVKENNWHIFMKCHYTRLTNF